MPVNRQQRQYGLSQIGVTRAQSDGSIAAAVGNFAQSVYERSSVLASEAATEFGEKNAYTASRDSIASVDPTTGEPMAVGRTMGMGRVATEAFERVALRRFESTMTDDISAKKAEIMQRVSTSTNAPQLFESAFSQYLEGLGQGATGYYRGVIVEQGGSSLADGVNRLRVAQIARAQAEAAAARERAFEIQIENAFNAGVSGNPFSLATGITQVNNEEVDYEAIGVVMDNSTTLTAAQRKMGSAWVAGNLTTHLSTEAGAVDSELLYDYFASGGSEAASSRMTPETMTLLNQFKNLAGNQEPSDLIRFAKDHVSIFRTADSIGGKIRADRLAEQVRIENLADAERRAYVDLAKENAVNARFSLQADSTSGTPESYGELGTFSQVSQYVTQVNSVANSFDPNIIGADAYQSILNNISDVKTGIAAGIVRREFSNLLKEDPSGARAKLFENALSANDTLALAGLMRPLAFNALTGVINLDNKSKLSGIVSSMASGTDVVRDASQAAGLIQLTQVSINTSNIFKDDNMTIDEKREAFLVFKELEGNPNINPQDYANKFGELSSQLITQENEHKDKQFDIGIAAIEASSPTDGVTKSLNNLQQLAVEFNAGENDPRIISLAQKIVNNNANLLAVRTIDNIPAGEVGFLQMAAIAQYIASGNINDSLSPEAKTMADSILDTITPPVGFAGSTITADRVAVSEAINSQMVRAKKTYENAQAIIEQQQFSQSAISGQQVGDASSKSVQDNYQAAIEEASGLGPDESTNLFEVTPETKAQVDALNLYANNTHVAPTALINSTKRLLSGSMSPERIPVFMNSLKNMLYQVDESGNRFLRSGTEQALGVKTTADVQALILVAELNPSQGLGDVIVEAVSQLNAPMDDQRFEEITGFKNRDVYMGAIGIPTQLFDEFEPLVNSYVGLYGADASEYLKTGIEARFTQNNNSYDATTGSSFSTLDYTKFAKRKEIEIGINSIVQNLNRTGEHGELYFTGNPSNSVEDMRERSFMTDFFTDTDQDATRMADGARRVLVGRTADSSAQNPKWQLYAVDQFGNISTIGNSAFNLNTLEISSALGTLTPPAPKGGLASDVGNTISEAQIEENLSDEGKVTLAGEEARAERVLTGPSYNTATPPERIQVDDNLSSMASQLHGSNSSVAKKIKRLNDLNDLQAKQLLRGIINETENLPASDGRASLLDELYNLNQSLRGR